MTFTQPELFPTAHYAEQFLVQIDSRLPRTDELTVTDVCAACNVSTGKVYSWIDEGEIVAVDHGTSQKPFYKIYRPSVLAHYRRRLVGSAR